MANDNENSLGDQNTFDGGDGQFDPQSLGDEGTFAGGGGYAPQSLGDEMTFGGGANDADDTFDDGMEVVDLESRYKMEGVLGKGGMGEVLLATDTRLNRKVAIKRILGSAARSKTAVSRFLTEAQSVAALNHPNIVQIYDYGRAKDGPFLIMEYVEGESLLDKCRQGPIELEEAVNLTCQLCEGLAKAHAANIIHRDIKPANVLLTVDGVPKLTDFGLAKDDTADTGMTMAGAVLGTLDFMPPEQRQDASLTDSRSDLWSLAASLYQMVTGKSPKIIKFNDVPAALQDVLARALEDEKEDRYQTAIDLRDALKESLQDSGTDISDIGEGECPHCRTKNDSSRKFCRSCAGSLEAPCLSCSAGMPMWENVCGSCGAKQEDLLQERREAMDAKKLQAEDLSADYQYAAATRIAEELGSESDLRLQHLKSWSERFISDCEKERQRELTRAAELLSESLAHEKAHDYPSGIKALEQVPEALQSEQISGQNETIAVVLSRLRGTQSECEQLHQVIRTRVKSRQLNGLLDEVEKLRELKPQREDLKKLQDQLIKRNEKMQQVRKASFQEALEAMDSQDYRKCLSALSKIDPYVEDDEIRDLREEADQKQQRFTELQDHIRTSIAQRQYDGLLDDVIECLALREGNVELEKLRDQLIERSEKQSEQVEAVLSKATQLRSQCKFEAAVETLRQIPEFLQNEEVESLISDCESLEYPRTQAITALRSAQQSESFAKGLEDSSAYQSILDSDDSLQDSEFAALRQQVKSARDRQIEEQESANRQKALLKKIWIGVGSSVAAVLLVIAVMWQMSVQRANQLASALEGQRWDEILAMEPENVTALIGRVNQKLLSANPDLAWILSEVDTIKSLDPVNPAVNQINGAVCALQSIDASAAGNVSSGETKLREAQRFNADASYLDRANKSLAVAYARRAESAVASGNITAAKADVSKAMSFDPEYVLPATVTTALAESQASEMVSAYETNPSDTNRDAAVASVNDLEKLNAQSAVLASLRSKMQSIPIALAESQASEMVSAYETNPSDTNRDAAVALLTKLESLDNQSPAFSSLGRRMTTVLVRRCQDSLTQKDYASFAADYDVLSRIDESAAQPIVASFSNLPPSVIGQIPPTINTIGMHLKRIPPGSFAMGDDNGGRALKPVHQVTLTQPFMLGVYEVTQEQYERVMGSNPSKHKGPQNPVEQVTWEDAMEFCRKLSALPEEKSAARVYRLPTEAEWEYACRAGTTTEYGFGDDESALGEYAWYADNAGRQTHPVGQKRSNAWGLYDMHGNVWEWCADWYADYPSGSVTDPTGPQSGSRRVNRGGSWNYTAEDCRSANRFWNRPSSRYTSYGFRVTCVLSGQ